MKKSITSKDKWAMWKKGATIEIFGQNTHLFEKQTKNRKEMKSVCVVIVDLWFILSECVPPPTSRFPISIKQPKE